MKAWTRGLLWLGPSIAALHASSGNIIRTKIRSAPASPSWFFFYCLAPTKYQNIYVAQSVAAPMEAGFASLFLLSNKTNRTAVAGKSYIQSWQNLFCSNTTMTNKGVQLRT